MHVLACEGHVWCGQYGQANWLVIPIAAGAGVAVVLLLLAVCVVSYWIKGPK